MKKILLLLLLLQICLPDLSRAQKFDAKKLEAGVMQIAQKAYASAVLIKPYDTVSKRPVSGMFSGVVIDAEGYVLSAAHAVTPNMIYQLYFPDGKTCMAKGLGEILSSDAAVLKIIDKGVWPFSEMGWSGSLKKYEPCISIAYPGSLPQLKPTLRFGYVVEARAKNGFIHTTCLMEPGDSGGPVFDMQGRVIGLHSQIEMDLDKNFEIAIDQYRKYWKALTVAKTYTELPVADSIPTDPLADKLVPIAGLQDINETFAKLESSLERSTFVVKSGINGKECIALATLLNVDSYANKKLRGESFLVSKSSMVGDTPMLTLKTGKVLLARIVKRDEANDLVLLAFKGKMKNGIELFSDPGSADRHRIFTDSIDFAATGKFLISPHPENAGEVSVLGNHSISIKGVPSSGFLGIATELKAGLIVLTSVQRRSPASFARLQVGDQLLSVNDKVIKDPVDLVTEIQKYKPEQKVKLSWKRGAEQFTKDVTLASRLNTRTHLADQFADGKSERRFGFTNVFVHDGKLKPSECGGPVFDKEGKFYGINIARFSRTSSLAVPAKTVVGFVMQALATSIPGG